MKLFQKLIAAPAIISLASGFAVNATEINSTDLSDYSNSNNLVSLGDFKSDTLFPGDWAYDSLKDLTNSPKFNGNSVSRLEAAAELNNLIAGGEGLMNGAAIDRLSDELGSELAIMKGRVDGLESRVNTIEAGSFSSTTSMKGKVEAMLAAQSTDAGANDAVMFNYHYEVDLNTSFTGDDKLNVEIAAGNQQAGSVAAAHDALGETSDNLAIEDVNYTFPVGEWALSVGESMDASKNWPNSCKYGNVVDNIGDCGASNSVDLGGDISISAGRDFGDGWSFGLGASADDGETNAGMFTEEGDDRYGLALGYENDTYGVTLAYSSIEDGAANNTYVGATAYYNFEPFTLSGGIEWMEADLATDENSEQWTVGITTEMGPGEISAGIGTNGAIDDNAEDLHVYEVKYSYPVNDSVTLDTFAYVAETVAATDDTTAVGFLTTFKF